MRGSTRCAGCARTRSRAPARHANGEPNFSLTFYILNAKGEHAGVSMYAEDEDYRGWAGNTDRGYMKYAVCDRQGPRMVQCEGLVQGVNRAEA